MHYLSAMDLSTSTALPTNPGSAISDVQKKKIIYWLTSPKLGGQTTSFLLPLYFLVF